MSKLNKNSTGVGNYLKYLKKEKIEMGEIAEMMLDGTMCACCGEWLNDGEDGDGFPAYCESCDDDFEEKPE